MPKKSPRGTVRPTTYHVWGDRYGYIKGGSYAATYGYDDVVAAAKLRIERGDKEVRIEDTNTGKLSKPSG